MNSNKVLKEIEKQTEKEFLPIIGPKKAEIIIDLIQKFQPKTVLEIGTLVGYSAIVIASHIPPQSKVVSIEIDPHDAIISLENIKKAGLSKSIELKVGNALNLLPNLDGLFDFLFIDAGKTYLEFLKLCEKNIPKGGIVVADNVKIFHHRFAEYLHYVRNQGGYKSQTIMVDDDAIEVSEKLF